MINNWINQKEIYPLDADNEKVLEFKKKYELDGKFVIMYSDNIGLYLRPGKAHQGFKAIPQGVYANRCVRRRPKDGREVVFAFVSVGSFLDKPVLYSKKHHFENIVFIPYQDKADLIYSLNVGNVHWCVNAKGSKAFPVRQISTRRSKFLRLSTLLII